jgi:serine/threonine-protein kinase
VFLAKTDGPMGFEKHLVIKRILPHLAEDPQFVAMFLGEAKLAARLNHPNLVQLFDFGEAEGSYFIAMEYIDGPTLRLLLARARDLRAPLTFALSARIVSSAAEGLAYAHDFRDPVTDEPLHLVHRDVSPDNILVGRSGAVKLVDFGIAKARGQTHHTQAGTVKGKVAYMAPEQLRGESLDRRVDLYALGVVLYELCTGRMPFEANSDASMVRAVLYNAAIPAVRRVPNLPPPIQAILDRLLAKDPNARYPDCRTLHADLETFIRSTGEATNGFALSRMVAQLAPPAPPAPAPATPPRPTRLPPGVTASAFAPTSSSPVLLSEPVEGAQGAVRAPALEALDLDRTVRSDSRRHAPPPVAGMDVRPTRSNTPSPGASAFVFPTALEDERLAVTPVTIGMERPDTRRRTTGTIRRLGGGENRPLRIVGVTALFLALAAIGAYLGLAAAHRTDLLARVGLPVPGMLAPASQQGAPTPAPVATTPPGPAPAAPVTTPLAGGTTPPTVAHSDAPAPGAGAKVTPPPSTAPTTAPAPPAAPPATTAALPGAGPAATTPPASGAATTSPGTIAPPHPPASTPAPTERAARPGAAGAAAAAGIAARGEPASAGTESGAAEGTPAKPSKATREADREKLLGAFAELEAAKESTVRLESTPKLRVRMGGKIVGTTPVTLTVPAQDAPVELEFFDPTLGVSKAEQLTLKPGDNGIHKVEIARGKLVLKVDDGLAVSVDGKSVGTTPLDPISLFEGKHTVQLTRGEQKERRTLEIQGDEETELEFSFPEAE